MDSWDPLAAGATILGALITLAGGFVLGSISRGTKLKVAEQRLVGYQALWTKLKPARYGDRGETEAFDAKARDDLSKAMTTWFYDSGIVLTDGCRNMFLNARHNLTAQADSLKPPELKDLLDASLPDGGRADLSREQMSLLRTRMKADLGQFGRWYRKKALSTREIAFLKECGENVNRRPWTVRR
jgi:hypothetical protein